MSDALETILNVDDSEAIRYAKSRALRRAGFCVVEAATGAEALRLASMERPALVLLDINLPDISGLEVCRRIKQTLPAMLVLQSSASFVDAEDRVRGLDGGADSYLTEPVTSAELVASVRALLRLRRAERTAQESEARYRAMIESATDYAIVTIDFAGRVIAWNRGAEHILGFAVDEIIGQSLDLIFTPEDRAAGCLAEEMHEARERGYAPDERWMQRRSGERFWANGIMRPLHDNDGVLQGYLKILRDESARRRTEEALVESEAKFRAITDAMPQIVWSAAADGRHDYYNRRWYEFIGIAQADCTGEEWTRLMHPDDREAAMRQWQQALATGADYGTEFRLRRGTDGAWRWFIARALPVRNAADRITSWFGTCTDVQELVEAREVQARGRDELERLVAARTSELTHALDRLQNEMAERERAEEVLRQRQKMEAVGQLTGGIAHDFNNLLAVIGGSVEMVRTRIAQGRADDVASHLATALSGVARGASLTYRLLAFARHQALDPKPVDVNGLVASMLDLIGRTLGSPITLTTALHRDVWMTLCDANQLENVLLNLCINARDAMPEGGRLIITTSNEELSEWAAAPEHDAQPGGYVVLSVGDTGTGMTPEVAARAFEPFYTTKPLGQGTGLGLSMTYGFAKQSGGHVRIESEPRRGTTIRLYLPRCHPGETLQGVHAETLASQAAPPSVRRERAVLVVEDEAVVRALIVERLTDLGYAVREAADGPAGLRILQSKAHIDLLVSDVGLPGLNGRQLADAARVGRPDLKVLFITGYAHSVAVGWSHLPIGMETLAKPFTMDAIVARVRGMIEDVPRVV
jgi:PAS domain S-box-containing protein